MVLVSTNCDTGGKKGMLLKCKPSLPEASSKAEEEWSERSLRVQTHNKHKTK